MLRERRAGSISIDGHPHTRARCIKLLVEALEDWPIPGKVVIDGMRGRKACAIRRCGHAGHFLKLPVKRSKRFVVAQVRDGFHRFLGLNEQPSRCVGSGHSAVRGKGQPQCSFKRSRCVTS